MCHGLRSRWTKQTGLIAEETQGESNNNQEVEGGDTQGGAGGGGLQHQTRGKVTAKTKKSAANK